MVLIFSLNHSSSFCNQAQQKPLITLGIKKFQAWAKYRDGDYNDALKRYQELKRLKPKDAFYNYMLGKCYLHLNNYDAAITHFETAMQSNPHVKKDLYLKAARAYHLNGDLNMALRHYNIYITSLSPQQLNRDQLTIDYIRSIQTAKELKANPVNVTVTKLGTEINSSFDDASPGLSPDGKTIYFTSRRTMDNIHRRSDQRAENDKMYKATWDEQQQRWGTAELVEIIFDGEGHVGSLSMSHDGKFMFIYKNIFDRKQSGNIFYSTLLHDGTWSRPVDIGKPVNSSFFESSAALSPDGNTLYFVSERTKGFGNADIYRSQRLSANKWSTPENLGAVINSAYDELGIFIHPDGQTLYFSSNGHRTMGGYDIFKSTLEDGVWSQPQNLGYPINTEFDEKHFVLSADGNTAYISSNRNGGVFNIYEIDMTNYTLREPVERVVEYIRHDGKTMQKYAIDSDEKTTTRTIAITVYNSKNNNLIASVNTNEKGEVALKLQRNETYSISFDDKDNSRNIATINTYESGNFVVTTSQNEKYLVNVEKTRRHSLVNIRPFVE